MIVLEERRISSPHFQHSSVHFTNNLFHVCKISLLILIKNPAILACLAPLRRVAMFILTSAKYSWNWEQAYSLKELSMKW